MGRPRLPRRKTRECPALFIKIISPWRFGRGGNPIEVDATGQGPARLSSAIPAQPGCPPEEAIEEAGYFPAGDVENVDRGGLAGAVISIVVEELKGLG